MPLAVMHDLAMCHMMAARDVALPVMMPARARHAMRLAEARHIRLAAGADARIVLAQARLDAAAIRNRIATQRERVVAAGLLARLFGGRLRLRRRADERAGEHGHGR